MQQYSYNKFISPPAPGLDIDFPLYSTATPLQSWIKIDTGADKTLIPQAILCKIPNAKAIRPCNVKGFDGAVKQRLIYQVDFEVAEKKFEKWEVISSPGNSLLLGRDILNQWKLILDGRNLIFKIE